MLNILSGIVVLIAFGFALLGLVYGRLSNQIQSAVPQPNGH